ncbi:MAG: DUF131 domain-containing protein [Thaumarchaeota archaeon]|nr:DUF131 domain-containing protein [Candidatus Calditenuaceae archaeon]MDW8187420.1 DUF131 domain-containing protein [Nitrososphaerota archaeon]
MRAAILALLLVLIVAVSMLALMVSLSGGEVTGFGFLLIGPIPIIVSDGQATALFMVAALVLIALIILRLLR